MNTEEMALWPATPGPERIAKAEALNSEIVASEDAHHNQTIFPLDPSDERWNQTHGDTAMLIKIVDILSFTHATKHYLKLRNGTGFVETGYDLIHVATRAKASGFLGMVIRPQAIEEPSEYVWHDGEVITCLYNDPEWVGFNPHLPLCKGLHVHIFTADPESDQPNVVVAAPPGSDLDEFSNMPGPLNELNQAIHDAVIWHGATGCSWHLNTPGAGL